MTESISENCLRSFQQPARYLGGEPGSVKKLGPEVELRACLAFPDRYEVGISHLGLQILYDLINRYPYFAAERVYLPLPDYEKFLRDGSSALCSLESQMPLAQFDLIGFSLQYELCATEVLAMLDLGQIPLSACDREEHHPIVVAGGPVTTQPEPFAEFFDAMVIGDGEEVLVELMERLREAKQAKLPRAAVLASLAEIKGVYIPSFFSPEYDSLGRFKGIKCLKPGYDKVDRRVLPSLADAPFPIDPLVPNVKAVHERLTIEIMRGCVRGCRFCQAGFICRPQREKPIEEVISLIENGLANSGYDEVSLLSLSTTDYCNIVPLLLSLQQRLSKDSPTTISFPSSRVDTLHPKLLKIIQKQRSSSFTIAPEAGTQRLRNVINKRLTDEEILATCQSVFEMGFKGLKLYFMIGLPTETDQDLYGIVSLAKEIKRLASKRQSLTISVSGFVPKAHTPFQWAPQLTLAELVRRQRLLQFELKRLRINYRYHEAGLTVLEGMIARGDRRVGAVIRRAYEGGCRMTSASQRSSWESWNNVLTTSGESVEAIQQQQGERLALPWQHISTGVAPDFLALEWKRALEACCTPDCLDGSCAGCGVCNQDIHNVFYRSINGDDSQVILESDQIEQASKPVSRLDSAATDLSYYRVHYSKTKPISFFSHLELINLFFRILRRAKLPVAFTQGFSPHPRVGFGPPLQLGVSSNAELLDLTLTQNLSSSDIMRSFNQVLPEGLDVINVWEIERGSKSIQESIAKQWYQVKLPQQVNAALVAAKIQNWKMLEVRRVRKDSVSQIALEAVVADMIVDETDIKFTIKGSQNSATVKPIEVVELILGEYSKDCAIVKSSFELTESNRS